MKANKLKKISECKGKVKDVISDNEILQLCIDGVCPHYVIINPITKEESIWFMPSELNEWFESNYILQRTGTINTTYTFLHFNNSICEEKGQVPTELTRINNLYTLPIENISTPAGVYFLCKGKKIQYIGQAVNVGRRIIDHMNEGVKEFDKVYFITCHVKQLSEVEKAFIRYFQPTYNKTSLITPNDFDINLVNSLMN
jgi:hypothetical protein